MTDYSEDDTAQKTVKERLAENEPVVDTVVLDVLQDMDMPLRGPVREEALVRFRKQLKHRRSVEGVSNRLATQISQPMTSAMKETIEGRIREGVEKKVQEAAQKMGDSE